MDWKNEFFDNEDYEKEIFLDMLIEDIRSYFSDKFNKEVYFVPFFVFADNLEDSYIILNILN